MISLALGNRVKVFITEDMAQLMAATCVTTTAEGREKPVSKRYSLGDIGSSSCHMRPVSAAAAAAGRRQEMPRGAEEMPMPIITCMSPMRDCTAACE